MDVMLLIAALALLIVVVVPTIAFWGGLRWLLAPLTKEDHGVDEPDFEAFDLPDDGCPHTDAARVFLRTNRIRIYGEGTEEPDGWVNVTCEECGVTFQILMDYDRYEEDE